jgi:hypothetical protein
VTCDCCGDTFLDEVGLVLVTEAIHAYRDGCAAKEARDREAWAAAEHATQMAMAAAR